MAFQNAGSRLNVQIACGKLLAAFSFACGPYFSSITPTNQLYYAWNVSCDPKGQSSSHQFIYSNLDYIHPLFSFMISSTSELQLDKPWVSKKLRIQEGLKEDPKCPKMVPKNYCLIYSNLDYNHHYQHLSRKIVR